MNLKYSLLVLVLVWLMKVDTQAQDIHFSQVHKAPLQLNPALTANTDWDVRMGANWRQQWVKVPVNYQTFGGFYDFKYDAPFLSKGYLGLGVAFIHDQAGDSQLSWTQLGVNAAYYLPLDDELTLSVGLGFDGGQRAFRANQLQFSDQYNGELFDPNQLTTEQFAQQSIGYTSVSTGVNLKRQFYKSRTFLQVGVALDHLNRPTIRFLDESAVRLPLLLKTYTNGLFEVSNDWDATIEAFWARQGQYLEFLFGAGTRYHLPLKDEKIMIGAGVAYRWADAVILKLEGSYQQWHWGLSYDINISNFQLATNGRGGLELAVQYFLLKAKPPEEFKSCPIF